jgi:hypothetical protein
MEIEVLLKNDGWCTYKFPYTGLVVPVPVIPIRLQVRVLSFKQRLPEIPVMYNRGRSLDVVDA